MGEIEDLFLCCPRDVLEVSVNEIGVLRKKCGIEMCRETYSKG